MILLLRMGILAMGIALLGISSVVALARQTPSPAAWIIYVQSDNNTSQLYRMWWDGSHAKALTDAPLQHFSARWSPDGSQIAYLASDGGRMSLNVMQADGKNPRMLLKRIRGLMILGNWSYNSRWLLLESNRIGNFELYRMTVDEAHNLTINPAYDGAGSWSPDNEWLVFESARTGNLDLYRMRTSGSRSAETLAAQPFDEASPIWSPDGAWIAYIARANTNRDVFITRPDGSETRQITHNSLDYHWVTWSPDSQQLIFMATDRRLFTAQVDSSDFRVLTSKVRSIEQNSWSPDGRWIIVDSTNVLYRLDPATGVRERLTDYRTNACCASWSPVMEQAYHGGWLWLLGGLCILINLVYCVRLVALSSKFYGTPPFDSLPMHGEGVGGGVSVAKYK